MPFSPTSANGNQVAGFEGEPLRRDRQFEILYGQRLAICVVDGTSGKYACPRDVDHDSATGDGRFGPPVYAERRRVGGDRRVGHTAKEPVPVMPAVAQTVDVGTDLQPEVLNAIVKLVSMPGFEVMYRLGPVGQRRREGAERIVEIHGLSGQDCTRRGDYLCGPG